MSAPDTSLDGGWIAAGQSERDALQSSYVTGTLIDILNTIDAPIIVVDRNASMICFNRAAAEVFGLTGLDIRAFWDHAETYPAWRK